MERNFNHQIGKGEKQMHASINRERRDKEGEADEKLSEKRGETWYSSFTKSAVTRKRTPYPSSFTPTRRGGRPGTRSSLQEDE
jgi:hypothetical protein